MELKAIKISKKNYEWLCELAGKIQSKEKRTVPIDEALSELRKSKKLSDLAGTWKMNDKEAKKFLERLHKGWRSWKTTSA